MAFVQRRKWYMLPLAPQPTPCVARDHSIPVAPGVFGMTERCLYRHDAFGERRSIRMLDDPSGNIWPEISACDELSDDADGIGDSPEFVPIAVDILPVRPELRGKLLDALEDCCAEGHACNQRLEER